MAPKRSKASILAPRIRMNLYLTPEDILFVKEIRKSIVGATGDPASNNVCLRTAIRCADLSKTAEIGAAVIAEDRRRKAK